MKVSNNTSYDLIAFGWHITHGCGDDVKIEPGQFADILGPYVGEMDDGSCYIIIEGEIACQETPDDNNGFQVIVGSQLNLQKNNKGITVRHFSEERIM